MSKRKCIGKTKAGNPCKANALNGSDRCQAHQLKQETRGRKKGEKIAMIQPIPKSPMAYTHPSNLMCGEPDTDYPAFLERKCDTLMKPYDMKKNGLIKYWKCPKCGHTSKTAGQQVKHAV